MRDEVRGRVGVDKERKGWLSRLESQWRANGKGAESDRSTAALSAVGTTEGKLRIWAILKQVRTLFRKGCSRREGGVEPGRRKE